MAAAAHTSTPPPASSAKSGFTEDWLAVCIGLFLFLLSLGMLWGKDVFGWAITTAVYTDLSKALVPASKGYAGLNPYVSLVATFLFLLIILSIGARALKANVRKFVGSFAVVFACSYVAWIIGSWAYIAATPNQRAGFKIPWSMSLTNEAGYVIALILGLVVGNALPGVGKSLKEAIRPELYIKTAIVLLGGFLGIAALDQRQLATSMLFSGACAIVVAYLIYWPIVYFIARRYFGFSREWAAPLASGISICGVSAAIATGGAIRSRPVVPVMVSSLVVIFAVVELLVLPFAAAHWLWRWPMVAGAWMGLAVKTDGAAVASGAIADSLVRAKALSMTGVNYAGGWIMGVSATVKVFIDVFIGVWAFVLAWVWSTKIERREGERVNAGMIWQRFPKFVLGYVGTFVIVLAIGLLSPAMVAKTKAAMGQANVFRAIFFVMTFFTIGVLSNFRKLWEEGIGKLAVVYILCLFGYIIWVGLGIAFIFFHGMVPPLAKG